MSDPILSAYLQSIGPQPPGVISIVGTGPGDAGLISVKAALRIRRADVVVHDMAPDSSIWQLVPPDAVRVQFGRRRFGPRRSVNELVEIIKPHVASGRRIVRLKSKRFVILLPCTMTSLKLDDNFHSL